MDMDRWGAWIFAGSLVRESPQHVCRLEEMNESRQSMVQRLKIVERERDGLEGARAAAEAYLDKERECTTALCTIYQVWGAELDHTTACPRNSLICRGYRIGTG